MREIIREELNRAQDEKYRDFIKRLIPTLDVDIIGVRVPILRKIAKKIARSSANEYLLIDENMVFEEIMLQALVIGYKDCDLEEHVKDVKNFVPKIDNWSVCDIFCNSLKFTEQNRREIWKFLLPYAKSDSEYEVRFAVVMFLSYFIEEPYIQDIFDIFDSIKHQGYYAGMAIAWAISMCYIVFPEQTVNYLNNNSLPLFIYQKSLQKIIESRKVSAEEKEMIRAMKNIKKEDDKP